jgi:hypothetical protein
LLHFKHQQPLSRHCLQVQQTAAGRSRCNAATMLLGNTQNIVACMICMLSAVNWHSVAVKTPRTYRQATSTVTQGIATAAGLPSSLKILLARGCSRDADACRSFPSTRHHDMRITSS